MSKKSNKILFLAIATAALLGLIVLIINNYKTKTSFKYQNKTAEELKPNQNEQDSVSKAVIEDIDSNRVMDDKLLNVQIDDIVLGDKNAPVTMIEYASLSCPHCASFSREAFDRFKEEYIDNGQVKFIYRDFPLNQQALVAAMFALCQAEDNKSELPKKYFDTVKALFKTQDSWAFSRDFITKLEGIAKLDGMSSERFQACINDKNLQEKILDKRMKTAKSLQIKSTPSFFVNGEILEGYVDYRTITKLIDKKLAQIHN